MRGFQDVSGLRIWQSKVDGFELSVAVDGYLIRLEAGVERRLQS